MQKNFAKLVLIQNYKSYENSLSSETYYNLKENEVRQLERIEEGFMRQVLKTTKGCPISQMYLEFGQIPARFSIIKLRLLFLKYILNQDQNSMLFKFLDLQFKQSTRGDWGSTCLRDLKDLNINLTLDEIKDMTKTKFKTIIKTKIEQTALIYLNKKRGTKGKEIEYSEIKMAEYLLPNNTEMSIDNKRNLFSIRNRIIELSTNFPLKYKEHLCVCGAREEMKHIYTCKILNSEKEKIQYEQIFSNNLKEQTEVLKRFIENYEKIEKYKYEK